MDKKKVKEHIQRALVWIDPMTTESANYETAIKMAAKNLEFAMEELSKSDWVSVEDGLPEYDKSVLVCNEKEPSDIWFAHRTADRNVIVDEHEFAKGYGEITHWQRIKELGK